MLLRICRVHRAVPHSHLTALAAPRRLARLGSNRPFGIEKEHDHLSQARFLDRGLGSRPFDVPSNSDQNSI